MHISKDIPRLTGKSNSTHTCQRKRDNGTWHELRLTTKMSINRFKWTVEKVTILPSVPFWELG